MNLSWMPALNASLNALSAVLLAVGLVLIKRGRREAHKAAMLAACASSAIFLVCYLIYHAQHGATRYQGQGWMRPLYFTILLTHTLLAVVNVPLVVMTLSRALKGQFERHRAIAPWTWAVWMYISVTGVAIYVMLYRL